MNNTLLIEKATEEIEAKNLGATRQFLAVHQVVYIDGRPKVARVDTEKENGTVIVYFSVVDELFYLAVYLDTMPFVSVRHVDTQPYHTVCFKATSGELNYLELSNLTTLSPTGGWNIGEKKKFGNAYHKFSALEFEPNPGADEFDDKIKKPLTFLEQDKDGVKRLVEKAGGYIQVTTSFHNGNTMLGGHHLNIETVSRLASMNLAVDFDIYADGNLFNEPL